ncbi:MAG: hypothetical protein G01um101472_431, partial [Parcubacteria group bacterium Gr01-1014_72]
MNSSQNGFINILLVALVVIIVGVAGYFVLNKSDILTRQVAPSKSENTPIKDASNASPNIPSSSSVKNNDRDINIPDDTSTTNVNSEKGKTVL